MPEKKQKNKQSQSWYYKIEENRIIRLRNHCPKCGAGYFLAEHKDRLTCGSCNYTEFKKK